jgi:hypothetical protein
VKQTLSARESNLDCSGKEPRLLGRRIPAARKKVCISPGKVFSLQLKRFFFAGKKYFSARKNLFLAREKKIFCPGKKF